MPNCQFSSFVDAKMRTLLEDNSNQTCYSLEICVVIKIANRPSKFMPSECTILRIAFADIYLVSKLCIADLRFLVTCRGGSWNPIPGRFTSFSIANSLRRKYAKFRRLCYSKVTPTKCVCCSLQICSVLLFLKCTSRLRCVNAIRSSY